MLEGSQSGCINHPGVEATVRCKQCARPVCDACVVQGPTGRFCSVPCKEKHQAFIQQAQQLDGKARSGFFVRVRNLVGALVIIAAVLVAVGVVATMFDVPILVDIVDKVREVIGV